MPINPPESANDFGSAENAGWRACQVCGTKQFKGILYFDSGSVAPTVGETVTGATTGDTGVIEAVYLRSGSYAGLDAAGCLEFSSVTGYERANYTIFQNNENLNGSTSGANFATAANIGSVVINGVLYPEQDMIEYQGQWYCRPHFFWKFGLEWKQELDPKPTLEKSRSYD
jgi:hypothetical protein